MPDPHFADPRLAVLYDDIDDDRSDLDHYVEIVTGHHARSVLDIGCGTGTFACRLATRGLQVTGVDPALAALDVARWKPGADLVRWIHGTTAQLPPLVVDVATMTANVAQVFLGDDEWANTLDDVHSVLRSAGLLVFETRIPERRAWEEWTPQATRRSVDVAGVAVEYFQDLLEVALPFVRFRATFRFARDGTVLTSETTLRFRDKTELTASLEDAGFEMLDVRDAPDRPGREYVFLAQRIE